MPSTSLNTGTVDTLICEVRYDTTQTASSQYTPFRSSQEVMGDEMSLHALEQLRVGQIPAEEPTCGETSVEQHLVWVESEGGVDCAGGLDVEL